MKASLLSLSLLFFFFIHYLFLTFLCFIVLELAALLIPKYQEAIKLGVTAVLSAPVLGELDDLGLITTAEDSQGASSSLDAAEASIRRPLVHYEWDGPLPHVIGTKEFQEDEFCGLYIAPFEEEPGVLSDISANNPPDPEEDKSAQEMVGETRFSSAP